MRAQRKALEIIASFAQNEAAEDLLQLPRENAPAVGGIEMVSLPQEMLNSILTAAMDCIAQHSGGKRDTQKELAAALMAEVPFPDKLVASLMGYAGHWHELGIAQRLCWAFRGRRISMLHDTEMTEYFQVEAYLKVRRTQASFKRSVDRIRNRG